MIYLILLDFFISSITKYNLYLFLLLLPNIKYNMYIIVYLLILSFFEIKYIISILLIILLTVFIKFIYKYFKKDNIYWLLVIISYLVFVSIQMIF